METRTDFSFKDQDKKNREIDWQLHLERKSFNFKTILQYSRITIAIGENMSLDDLKQFVVLFIKVTSVSTL